MVNLVVTVVTRISIASDEDIRRENESRNNSSTGEVLKVVSRSGRRSSRSMKCSELVLEVEGEVCEERRKFVLERETWGLKDTRLWGVYLDVSRDGMEVEVAFLNAILQLITFHLDYQSPDSRATCPCEYLYGSGAISKA